MSTDGTSSCVAATPFDFSGFAELSFPENGDIVYVLCLRQPDTKDWIPFYVGESSRHVGRFGDYVSANLSASTDFKVGQAVKHLRERGCEVMIRYKSTSSRRDDEKSLIQLFEAKGLQLLNSLGGYKYSEADPDQEKAKVREFVANSFFGK